MHLFADYIQPLMQWLNANPHWGLFFTFIISFTEALAFIGSLVPGTVLMTTIGILAGSGVMSIKWTLIAGVLGAMAGDSFSFFLGSYFSERFSTTWPFNRYPNWINYGKEYFAKHGRKSIVIGRFVGPLRAVIPVIAGMMHMNRWHFFLANFFSAILWAFVYIMPGVLIGIASSDLSPESATRLFFLIILALIALWFVSVLLKRLLSRVSQYLRHKLHAFWMLCKTKQGIKPLINRITPSYETDHAETVCNLLAFFFSVLLLVLLAYLIQRPHFFNTINNSTYLFLQSLRTYWFDAFFMVVGAIDNLWNILVFALLFSAIAIYKKDPRLLAFWLVLNIAGFLTVLLLQHIVPSPYPINMFLNKPGNSFPTQTLALFVTQSLFVTFYFKTYCEERCWTICNSILALVLCLLGLIPIYFGDSWLTDVLGAYCLAFALALLFWQIYRLEKPSTLSVLPTLALLITSLFLTTALYLNRNYETLIHLHQSYQAQYVIMDEVWWEQEKPLLPIYRLNRIGKPVDLFNLQYVGDLDHFASTLANYGWEMENETFFDLILKRFSGDSDNKGTPLLIPLYQNRKPVLIMRFQTSAQEPGLILRFWRSNYHLKKFPEPIWIGTVHRYLINKKNIPNHQYELIEDYSLPLLHIKQALSNDFAQREVNLSIYPDNEKAPILLLIRENI